MGEVWHSCTCALLIGRSRIRVNERPATELQPVISLTVIVMAPIVDALQSAFVR